MKTEKVATSPFGWSAVWLTQAREARDPIRIIAAAPPALYDDAVRVFLGRPSRSVFPVVTTTAFSFPKLEDYDNEP